MLCCRLAILLPLLLLTFSSVEAVSRRHLKLSNPFMSLDYNLSRLVASLADIWPPSRCNGSSDFDADGDVILSLPLRIRQYHERVATSIHRGIRAHMTQYTMKHNGSTSSSSSCLVNTLKFLIAHGISIPAFTAKLMDAQGKPGQGVFNGHTNWPVSWDECVSLTDGLSSSSTARLPTKLCTASLSAFINTKRLPINMMSQLCVPKDCPFQEIKGYVQQGINQVNKELAKDNVQFAFQLFCKREPRRANQRSVWFTLNTCVCAVLLCAAVIGTGFELALQLMIARVNSHAKLRHRENHEESKLEQEEQDEEEQMEKEERERQSSETNGVHFLPPPQFSNSKRMLQLLCCRPIEFHECVTLHDVKPRLKTSCKILLAMSVISNTQSLFCVDLPSSPSSSSTGSSGSSSAPVLSCLHGIRFLSMSWVILGHIIILGLTTPFVGNAAAFVKRLALDWHSGAIANATVSVDTFFVLSGLLTVYVSLHVLKSAGRHTWRFYALLILQRYIRLTPALLLVILLNTGLFPYVWDGPFWQDEASPLFQNCRENWWNNLLYVNNLINEDKMCVGHTWYLAADMQMFVFLAPLMILLCKLHQVLPLLLTLVGMIAHLISRINYFARTGGSIGALIFTTQGLSYFQDIYTQSYLRFGPYLLGMYTGFALFQYGHKLRNLSARQKLVVSSIIWPLVFTVFGLVIYSTSPYYSGHKVASKLTSISYNATFRIAWSLCVTSLIVLCCSGMGGPINRLLSWKCFVPISRLTYCAYLIHPSLMFALFTGVYNSLMLNSLLIVFLFPGILVISYAAAYVISILSEVPIMKIDKILLAKIG